MQKKTIQERAQDVLHMCTALEQARIDLEDAKSRYEFAVKQAIVIRDQYVRDWGLDWSEHLTVMDFPDHVELERDFAQDFVWAINRITLLGKGIRQACQSALRDLKTAPTEAIVSYMETRGFEFTGEPAREVSGALVKQPWAKKNPETGEWEFIPEKA